MKSHLTNRTEITNIDFDIVRFDRPIMAGECWSKMKEIHKAHVYFVYPKGERDLLLFQTRGMSNKSALQELKYYLNSVKQLALAAKTLTYVRNTN